MYDTMKIMIFVLLLAVATIAQGTHRRGAEHVFTHITSDVSTDLTTTTSEHNHNHPHGHPPGRHRGHDKYLVGYVEKNYEQLARNAASGQGPYIATLHDMTGHNRVITLENYRRALKHNYERLFAAKKPATLFLAELDRIIID